MRKFKSAILAMTSGSEYFGDGGIGGTLSDRDVGEQFLDDRVALTRRRRPERCS